MLADLPRSGFWTIGSSLLAVSLLAACLAPAVLAQTTVWPSKPIKIIVLYPPVSGPDLMAWLLAQSFQTTLKQTVVVDNKAGALGIVGTQEVARSAPDGYTLLLTTNTTQAANVALVKDLQCDPIKDFTAVSLLATASMMLLVPADSPIKNVDELVRQGRPAGKGLFAGYGSAASQVSTAKLRFAGNLNIVDVPYKGIPLELPLLRSGRAEGLGVTSLQRAAADPQIPALAETFPGFEVTGWQDVVAPAGTPDAVIEKLHDSANKTLAEPQNVERVNSLSFTPSTSTAKQFSGFTCTKWRSGSKTRSRLVRRRNKAMASAAPETFSFDIWLVVHETVQA